jgi:hypothetical protein
VDRLQGILDKNNVPRITEIGRHISIHTDKVDKVRLSLASAEAGPKFAWICNWPSEFRNFQIGVGETETKKKRKDLSVHIRTGLPLLAYSVQLQCSFQEFPLCPSISFRVAFSAVVPDDSKFMKACLEGDIFEVREQCKTGRSRPDDRTQKNMTPLMVC